MIHGSGPFHTPAKNGPPPEFGYIFMVMGGLAVVFGWLFGAAIAFSARSIRKRKHHMFSLIIAGVMCVMCNPFGTALGVFTFIVLLRPSVKELYGYNNQPA